MLESTRTLCGHSRQWFFVLGILLAAAAPGDAFARQANQKRQTPDKASQQSSDSSDDRERFESVESVNEAVPPVADPPDLSTPLATVENFLFSCQEQDFDRAAQSLDFAQIPVEQRQDAARFAEQFFYVLNQRLWIDVGDLPDRSDGQPQTRMGQQHPMAGEPRRNILLGTIKIDEWKEVRVRVQRVKPNGSDPLWLFSSQTVQKIPSMYDAFGPSWLEQAMPGWAGRRVGGNVPIWEWLALVLFVALGVAIGYATQRIVGLMILRHQNSKRVWYEQLIEAAALPLALASGIATVYLLKTLFLSMTGPVNTILDPTLVVLLVGAISWLVMSGLRVATSFATEHYVNTFNDDEDGAEQGLLTKISVARRVVTVVAVVIIMGIVLVQFKIFEVVGYGLLTSASVAAVILGIAAKPILGNLLAGLQIGLTQPVRIGDSVFFEDNWGYVEEIAFTYLTIRTWDQRRLVVPLQYLLSKPVENWTKSNSSLTQAITLHVDFMADVGKIRKKFEKLVNNHDLADHDREPVVQVTNCSRETIEVRGLCHAKSPSDAWNLHCDIRESMIEYIRSMRQGDYLPVQRVAVMDSATNGRN